MLKSTLPKTPIRVGRVVNGLVPRLRKRPFPAAAPPAAAAPVPVPAPPAPAVVHCRVTGCQIEVRQPGHSCPEHRAAWLALRYFGPEASDAVFTCVASGCTTVVAHRDFLCDAHWRQVDSRIRWKIHHYSELYRVFLGKAIADVAKKAGSRAGERVGTHDGVVDARADHERLG